MLAWAVLRAWASIRVPRAAKLWTDLSTHVSKDSCLDGFEWSGTSRGEQEGRDDAVSRSATTPDRSAERSCDSGSALTPGSHSGRIRLRGRTSLCSGWRERLERAVEHPPLDRETAIQLAELLDPACGVHPDGTEEDGAEERERALLELLAAARELARRGHGNVITVSRNVFIPLTNLCRDRCAYCTFAKTPDSPEAKTYALSEVRQVCSSAAQAGCREALFCLGDKPEVAYATHRRWLAQRGYQSTAEYLVDACAVACAEGMFPHTNAGVMSKSELAALRPLNASMGLMLENVSPRLRERGQAHYYCPDKDPERRLEMTRAAGELRIPFTSGILIGIGETPTERIDTLIAIRELDRQYAHIQEVIVQNFHPKGDTPMADRPTPSDALMASTVALARLLLGPAMNIQAPPNLSPTSLEWLLRSGVNDWGGVSPVTCDFINPEAPWPALEELRRRTEASGYELRERLAVYPEWIDQRPEFFAPEMLERLKLARAELESCEARGSHAGTRIEVPRRSDVPTQRRA